MKRTSLLTVLVAAAGCLQAHAVNIGNWSGSSRSWNATDFSSIKGTMIGAGHTVEANSAISAANLANDDVFIVGEATVSPGAGELSDLSSWLNAGGILIVLTDSGSSGVAGGNTILGGVGSAMTFSGSGTASATLSGGNFASEGPPYNIVGGSLAVSVGNLVNNANVLYGFGIHYQQIGSGYVFAFGDRYDHDFAFPTAANNNGKLFLNIVGGGVTASVPDAGQTLVLLGFASALLLVGARRQRLAAVRS